MDDLQIATAALCRTRHPKIYELIKKLIELGQTPTQICQRVNREINNPTVHHMIDCTARQLYQERK